MKVLLINAVYNEGSTGKICKQIHDLCIKNNIDCKTVCSYKTDTTIDEECFYASSRFETHIHNRLYRMTWLQGCFSFFHTQRCIAKIRHYDPDLIHLNVIHGSYLNHELLFRYIRKSRKKVIWTFHDCWAFTGFCPYFTLSRCEKWKTGCDQCAVFPSEKINICDTAKFMYKKKRKWYGEGLDMLIVTPSDWLANLTRQSFLKHYPVKVIHNGVNLEIFQPTQGSVREIYRIPESKKIVLGVAFGWGKRKGLDIFVELSRILPEDEYQIVLVGTSNEVDEVLPSAIISIHRTNNQRELAMLYTAADVFVNPTREENYPTVNMESLSCGTPVITFNTGGSPEIIDSNTGVVVDSEDVAGLVENIKYICENRPYSAEMCIMRAKQFGMHERYQEYIDVYKQMLLPLGEE